MGITVLSPTVGLMCNACHREQGLQGLDNLPPSDPHWHMPPREMAFENRSPAELCAQLKDPSKVGGRDLEALVEHVAEDHLVKSSWGSGKPPPPVSHEEMVEGWRLWVGAGGPCPE